MEAHHDQFRNDSELSFDGYELRPSARPSQEQPLTKPAASQIEPDVGPRPGTARPRIGAPNTFRRLDYSEGQRQSLIPLRLAPVTLRDDVPPTILPSLPAGPNTTAPPAYESSDSMLDLLHSARTSYARQRQSPYQRCQQRSSASLLDFGIKSSERVHSPTPLEEQRATKPLSRNLSSASLRKQAIEHSAASIASQRSSDAGRSKRKRSSSSMRRPLAEAGELDLDKEILELNTIVEQRRAAASKAKARHEHIPAVAPTMKVRARAETLTDIGSALSRPATAPGPPQLPPIETEDRSRPSTSRFSSSRVSGWLSGIMQSQSSSDAPSQEPFYKCRTPAETTSRTSLCSSVGSLESPSLTAATSPTKSHSRTLTAESRITPLSPATTNGRSEKRFEGEDEWPTVVTPSSVGLAF